MVPTPSEHLEILEGLLFGTKLWGKVDISVREPEMLDIFKYTG